MCPKNEPTEGTGPVDPVVRPDARPSAGPLERLTYRFEVFRYAAAGTAAPRFQAYDVTVDRNMSVLEALVKIQDEQDPSLAFRYACRGAVCGSCAMSVNGQLQLACRVQLRTLRDRRVVVEPLPGFEILKDLVVDLDAFWEKYRRVQPWLHAELAGTTESHVTEQQQARIDRFVNCILCGLCYAACPATRRNPGFTGPAALAKLYRFLADSREDREPTTLRQENSPEGLWACHTIMECCEVCPRDVRPAEGIRGLRRRALADQIQRVLGRTRREA